ncbi:hypothetical protein Aph01nite_69820 [Acrocarpospora phusangensis]|uniref:Secreted protein n=1 Tax=Acrocarpospora phusangensis TaxID=1070424 RepID=A0A919QGS8_9ACTN|nr:hypothetical protein [Acrocarpospora phusangensis]GIH28672.1 hypothetical protein Aph01nite_69820 [Acrocarpospora phusangensis]
MKILRKLVAAGVAAAGALLALPPLPAAAAPPPGSLVPVQQTVFGQVGRRVSGNVGCPVNTRVVAAGMQGNAVLNGLVPQPNFQAVIAEGTIQPGPAGSNFMIIQAICAPVATLQGWIPVRQTFAFAGSNKRRAILTCPSGMYAAGGGGIVLNNRGVFSTTSFGMVANSMTAAGNAWQVTVSTGVPSDTVEVITMCAPLDGSFVDQDHANVVNGTASKQNLCDNGRTVLSGGVYLSRADGTEADGFITHTVPSGTRGWFVGGGSTTPNSKIVALARCF